MVNPRDFAKKLRVEGTLAERLIWKRLRTQAPDGLRFRFQHPIGPYFADFFCSQAKLVIEIDGSSHHDDRYTPDMSREEWLKSQGYDVLRFTNEGVLRDLDGVMETIFRVAQEKREIVFLRMRVGDPTGKTLRNG